MALRQLAKDDRPGDHQSPSVQEHKNFSGNSCAGGLRAGEARKFLRPGHEPLERLTAEAGDGEGTRRADWPEENEQALLAAVVASAPCAIIGFTLAGAVTSWNAGAQRLFGYSAEAMAGQPLTYIVPAARRAELDHMLKALSEGECVDGLETVRLTQDGALIDVELSASPIVDPHGRLMGGASIERDITTRKGRERALRHSEERFRLMAENALDLVFLADDRGRFVYASPSFKGLLGYEPEELCGRRVAALVHPDDRGSLAHGPEEPTLSEFRIRGRDGAWRWMEGARYGVTTERGACVVGMARDIGVRKQLERELRHKASHDPLTGLPNRALFLDRLQHVIDRSQREAIDYAVLLLDLDDFKGVNDSHGHASGDQVLIHFTQRVRRALRPTDTFARLGGDEFGILLEDAGGRPGVWRVATRICQGLRSPFSSHGTTLYCRASIGATLGTGLPCRPGDLLRAADKALYQAKETGKACFAIV